MTTDPTLRPCFFCGDPIYPRESHTWKGELCYCGRCAHVYEISPDKWNSAYCWKLLDEKEKKIKQLQGAIPSFDGEKYYLRIENIETLNSIIKEKEARIRKLEEALKMTKPVLEHLQDGVYGKSQRLRDIRCFVWDALSETGEKKE